MDYCHLTDKLREIVWFRLTLRSSTMFSVCENVAVIVKNLTEIKFLFARLRCIFSFNPNKEVNSA